MAHIDELIAHLDALLIPAAFHDYGPNGLQVPGRTRVERVVTGVSAHRELIDRALALRADRFPDEGLPIAELAARVADVCGRDPLVFDAGPERVRTLGIVSGAGAGSLPEAVERGLDAMLTGEAREHVMADAREAGVHFI